MYKKLYFYFLPLIIQVFWYMFKMCQNELLEAVGALFGFYHCIFITPFYLILLTNYFIKKYHDFYIPICLSVVSALLAPLTFVIVSFCILMQSFYFLSQILIVCQIAIPFGIILLFVLIEFIRFKILPQIKKSLKRN